jgi:hypothetical protein
MADFSDYGYAGKLCTINLIASSGMSSPYVSYRYSRMPLLCVAQNWYYTVVNNLAKQYIDFDRDVI